MKIVVLADQTGLKEIQPSLTLIESCIGMFNEYSRKDDLLVQLPENIEEDIRNKNLRCSISSEPFSRGTAPALGLAAIKISYQNPDEVITIAYSDHPVNYKHKLLNTLKITNKLAKTLGKPILIGVNPTYPASNYGYVKIGKAVQDTNGKILFEMNGFKEKPSTKEAEELLQSWQYLWNTGYMTVKVETLLEIYKKYLPEIHGGLMTILESIGKDSERETTRRIFENYPKISIDKGIFEKINTDELLVMSVDLNINSFFDE